MSEDVTITVYLGAEDSGVREMLDALQGQVESVTTSVNTFNSAGETISVTLGAVGDAGGETGRRLSRAFSPVRTMSRDVWSLAYSFRRLNYTLFGGNETMKVFINALIAVGAALRILAVIESVNDMIKKLQASTAIMTTIQNIYNATLAQTAFWMGIITGGAVIALGLAAWGAASVAAPKGMITGGEVRETGTYYLHKGETVIPEGGPDYSQIYIVVNTGPINSDRDAEELFEGLASRIALEKRRRGI